MTIKEARTNAGFSHADITRLIGIPVNTLSQWERGLRKPAPWIEKLVIKEINLLHNHGVRGIISYR